MVGMVPSLRVAMVVAPATMSVSGRTIFREIKLTSTTERSSGSPSCSGVT